jgi:hypothetical protein
MKKRILEKPKKILFEKLTVKEAEKVKGGDPSFPPKPHAQCAL